MTATAVSNIEHYANAPDDPPMCGVTLASALTTDVVVGLFLDSVTCDDCLYEVARRTMGALDDPGLDDNDPDRNDLEAILREAVERLGEVMLMRHHPDAYADLMKEKHRPDEPVRLGAIVVDSRGVHWLKIAHSTASHYCWREFGAVRLGIEGEDDRRWEDVDAIRVVYPGILQP
jgi:hypothetical protein